jgi:hypothetical protein
MNKAAKSTIHDVARLAGVSLSSLGRESALGGAVAEAQDGGTQEEETGMARKSLQIATSEAVKNVLGSLGSPLVSVAVKGRVVSGAAANTLLTENITTSKSTTLPIIVTPATKKALAEAAGSTGSHEISLLGRVVHSVSGTVLLLDRVGMANRLVISADASTRELLGNLASTKNGEASIKVKVVERGGNKVLVLTGEGCCGKKKK